MIRLSQSACNFDSSRNGNFLWMAVHSVTV